MTDPKLPTSEPTPAPASYKVGVKTSGDRDWAYNALRFATREQAERYGADLAWRWTAVREYAVHPSNDAPGDEQGMTR